MSSYRVLVGTRHQIVLVNPYRYISRPNNIVTHPVSSYPSCKLAEQIGNGTRQNKYTQKGEVASSPWWRPSGQGLRITAVVAARTGPFSGNTRPGSRGSREPQQGPGANETPPDPSTALTRTRPETRLRVKWNISIFLLIIPAFETTCISISARQVCASSPRLVHFTASAPWQGRSSP